MVPAPGGRDLNELLRSLPSVERVREALADSAPPQVLVGAARATIDEARGLIRSGNRPPSFEEIIDGVRRRLSDHDKTVLQRVLNATGVMLHTNLGRAPLGREQIEAVSRVASGYSNLEYDLVGGARGSRYSHATRLLAQLTGAETALVVNNNAAAVLLMLAGLCADREVVISRGELVEIGGEFRIPEIMAISRARLVEVGTTNRTHLADYERAITPDTAAILKVHPSNYSVVGFTASVPAHELAKLARGRGVLLLHDLGSGLARPAPPAWGDSETNVREALLDGADVVTFSGDKLFGGPQAGIIAGRSSPLSALTRHALVRALRVDKMTLAALEATVTMYLEGRSDEMPLWAMASTHDNDLEERTRTLAARIPSQPGSKVEVVPCRSVAGGGSMPGAEIASWALAIEHDDRSPAELQRDLRDGSPPVIARVDEARVLLDLRTVLPGEEDALAAEVTRVLQ